MQRPSDQRRETLNRETLLAWEAFQDDGLHVRLDEVDRWLATWGTDNEVQAPVCYG
jgi:predicted transcriptional regulator